MAVSQGKIITKLRDRRQIETGFRQMVDSSSDLEYRSLAQTIASRGAPVIPTIVTNLDTADAKLLAAMGMVATLLDREEVSSALRRAVLHPQRTDRARIGAMTILERYLGHPPDDVLLSSLVNPEQVALASLEEMLEDAIKSPSILIEYVQGLDRQEPDVVLSVVRVLRGMSDLDAAQASKAIEPLRMMAQDVRLEIAEQALHALGAFRLPDATTALQGLVPVVHPELQSCAERLVRKLRFSGVEVQPLSHPEPEWRALVSPLNGYGQQTVWFLFENHLTAHARFLNLVISDRAGVIETAGHNQVPINVLPPRRAAGYVHQVTLPDSQEILLMLEVSFDEGRQLVRDALAINRETQIPVAGPLRLLGSWLWGVAGAEDLAPPVLPEPEDEVLLAETDQLLQHPAFMTWTLRSDEVFEAAEEARRLDAWDLDVWVDRLVQVLFAQPVVIDVLYRRLMSLSEWLWWAGEKQEAWRASVAGRALTETEPQKHPFVRALVERDLKSIMRSMETQVWQF